MFKTIYLPIAAIGLIGFFIIFSKPKPKEVKQDLVRSKSVCDEMLKGQKIDPVKKFEGIPAPVNFKKFPEAKRYYTVITESASSGPNYAGHFTFISWGCGMGCFQYAIVDSITGNIIVYNGKPTEFFVSPSRTFSINSRLLIINPLKDSLVKEAISLNDLIDKVGYDASLEREYYIIEEENDGRIRLNKVCSENVLEGLYSEVQ
jgi:hypothetical protein